jgi:hypothetical protein
MDTRDSTSGTQDRMTQRVIQAVGCQFTEYRGEGKPIVGQPPAMPGDVYFDLKDQPYTVWVYQSDSRWNQWASMADSQSCKHPEQDRILCPSVQRLAWVPISGYGNYLCQTRLRLGKRDDAADTHINIILDQERGVKLAPPPITAPSPQRSPTPDDSSDDEVEQLVQTGKMGSDAVDDVPIKSEVEIMTERRAVFENRCGIMRVQNEDIQKAVATCSGVWCIHCLCWLDFHRCNRARQVGCRTWWCGVPIGNTVGGVACTWGGNVQAIHWYQWTRQGECAGHISELTSESLSQDGNWIEYMARAANAIQMHDEEPAAVALELPEELRHTSERPRPSAVALAAREQFVKEIRNHVSNNRAVVIRGCCFSQCRGFSVEDIGMVRPSMSHSVYWHGVSTIVYFC